jgi:amidase
MDEVTRASATWLAAAIRSKRVSAEEVVAAHLRRIDRVNPGLNAVVQLAADRALAEARQADTALAGGEVRGPLHGVPFTAKDVFDTAGVVTAQGLPERSGFVPAADHRLVARLRGAGAILLGKTNCPPHGVGGETDNPLYGRTANPYAPSHSPGGSSGGEAAIVAAGGSPLGLGSDSGGSLRLPAHYCGIATLKPTDGRTEAALGDPRTENGPMARWVEDLAPAMRAIAGLDTPDLRTLPVPLGDPGAVRLRGLRLAAYDDDGVAVPTSETRAAVRGSAAVLAAAGAAVEERRPAPIAAAREITERWWRLGELPGPEVERLFADWDRFREEMAAFMDRYDALLCPADHRPALRYGEGDYRQFTYTLPFSLTGYPCVVVRAGTSPEGLPIGVQVAARPWREDVALAVAKQIETALGGWQPPPL